MDAKAKKMVVVGAVTAVLVSVLALSIIVVGGSRLLLGSRYTLSANFQDAQGLNIGSIVSLAGIQIGNVTSIKVHPDSNSVIVNLLVDEDHQKKITNVSKATIKTMGVLGDKFIYIEPANTGTPLKDGEFISVDQAPDFLTSLDNRASDLQYVGEILKESAELLKSINDNNRAALLVENLKNTSENLKELTGRRETHEAIIHMARILKKLDEGDGTLGRLINDPSLYDRLMDLTGASSRNRFLAPLIQNSIESSESSP